MAAKQHIEFDLFDTADTFAQNVGNGTYFFDYTRADPTPIGHNTKTVDTEVLSSPVYHRNQRFDIEIPKKTENILDKTLSDDIINY